MGVALVAEEDPAAPYVFVLIDRARRVPEVGGELAVSAGEEVVALGFVLADEEDVRCVATGSQVRVAPPPSEEGVVAAELVVVLVGAAGAVVLDQKEPRALCTVVGDFEGGVGDYWAWLRVRRPSTDQSSLRRSWAWRAVRGGVSWCSPCHSSSAVPSRRR
jgi:hypothetical protein